MTAPTRSDRAQVAHSDAATDDDAAALRVTSPASAPVASPSGRRRLGGWIDASARRGLQLGVTFKSGATVLSLQGRLDQQSAGVLKEGFPEVMSLTTRSIDVDLSGVSRVDGMGLAALVWAWGFARERGLVLRLLHMPAATRQIVTKMNLHHVLQVIEDGSFR